MALVDNSWYVNFGDGSTTGYYAVTQWATGTVIAAGVRRRQLATPTVGSERVFVAIVGGTTHATTEPTWVITRGGKTTDNTVTWQECTGIAALNGDATNTPSWTITATPPGGVKNTAVTLGQVIKRDSGASYHICSTAGTAGNGAEPAFSNTAGTTTADNTVTWTSLGVVGNFTGWQAPHARVPNALAATWFQTGNSIFTANVSAETQAALLNLTAGGTIAAPALIYSVNAAGSVPPVSADLLAGASITTTGNNRIILASGSIGQYFNGFTFNGGSGANAVSSSYGPGGANCLLGLENCTINVPTSVASTVDIGASTSANSSTISKIRFINTAINFSLAGHGIRVGTPDFVWTNTVGAIILGTAPTTLFNAGGDATGAGGFMTCQGVDFGNLGSGKTLVGAALGGYRFTFIDCKLGASVTVAGTPTSRGSTVDLLRCDSAAASTRNERYWYEGTQTVETTIVRTGGATDGTTPISWKLVSTANSKWVVPFESQSITLWNDSTSPITSLTFYGTTTGGGVPNNDDVWIEVEYLGSSATPQGSFKTTTKADNLASAATTNNSSDASTWGGSGAGNGFKIVVPSFTPAMAGPMNITIKVAKASTTYYIDPVPTINGVKVSTKSYIAAPGVYINERANNVQLINSQALIAA